MQSNLDFLVLYAEITMAFIAFATIVAVWTLLIAYRWR